MAERMAMGFLGSYPFLFEPIQCGRPTDDELEGLGAEIGEKWEKLGGLLGVRDQKLQEINQAHGQLCDKGYYMLKHWKEKEGFAATYKVVRDALKHELVRRPDLAEKFCHIKGISSPGESLSEGASEERVQGSHPSLFEPSKPSLCDPFPIWRSRNRLLEGSLGKGVVWPPPPLLESRRDDPPGIWSPRKRRWEGAFGEELKLPPPPPPPPLPRFLFESNPPLRWTRGKRLGAGNFGEVYECRERYRGILAVKIVKMEPQYTEKQKDVKALNNEISILKSLKHERIVSYHGSEQTDGHLHLFMDFMPGGSLSDHIKKYGVLSESKSKRFTQQMLEGICFLHSEDIIHRDIKGSNVLLDGDGNVKLADFGLSKMIQKVGSKTDLVSHCGTPHWMAPEIFWGEGYGRKADIWSLGCTVVEMLTGRPPLGHLEPAAAIFRIGSKPTEPTLPESVSRDAKEFIKAALTWKPNERPSSVELQCYTFVLNRKPNERPSSVELQYYTFVLNSLEDQ